MAGRASGLPVHFGASPRVAGRWAHGRAAERPHVCGGLPGHPVGQRDREIRHLGARNADADDPDERRIGRCVAEARPLEVRTAPAGAFGPMAPGALGIEDSLPGGDVARERAAEGSCLTKGAGWNQQNHTREDGERLAHDVPQMDGIGGARRIIGHAKSEAL